MGKQGRKMLISLVTAGYLLGISRGYVALWKDEDPEPLYRFPISASSLPPSDQLMLRQGICLGDLDDVLALLEDYR